MKKLALSYAKIEQFLILNQKEANELYHNKGFTARQLAQHFSLFFTPAFQKQCYRILGSKKMGLGGARIGSGNTTKNKNRKSKTKNIFVFNFSDEVTKLIKASTREDYNNARNFVEDAILWFSENRKPKS